MTTTTDDLDPRPRSRSRRAVPPDPPPAEAPSDDILASGVRLARGAGLAAVFGAAVGLRGGAASCVQHALGVPAAVLAVCAFAVPSLFVMLSLADAAVPPHRLFRSVAEAGERTGLLLAGFAPAAALFTVSSKSPMAAALGAALPLLVGAGLGLRSLVVDLAHETRSVPEPRHSVAHLVLALFTILSILLSARVWLATLSILHPGVAS